MRKLEQTEKDRVLFIVSDKLGYFEEEIDDTSNLRNDLGADSLDEIEICVEVEKEFNIKISDAYFEKVKTVNDLYECIEKFL